MRYRRQRVHDQLDRAWWHLDFFQFEAWLHAKVPRVACTACGKTTQVVVPWAREGSGFTALFEALALTPCRDLPVKQAAALLRCEDKQLWQRIAHYAERARAQDDMSKVDIVGIDETSLHRGQSEDMSAAYARGVATALPNAVTSYGRFHVVAMAVNAMDKVRQAEMRDDPKAVAQALGTSDLKIINGLMWGMRKNPHG